MRSGAMPVSRTWSDLSGVAALRICDMLSELE